MRIERRLSTLLETPRALAPAPVSSGSDSVERVITILGVPIVTVTRGDAEDNLSSFTAHRRHKSTANGAPA